jgi:hypothetical protein
VLTSSSSAKKRVAQKAILRMMYDILFSWATSWIVWVGTRVFCCVLCFWQKTVIL